ncbi:hypothetical protein [Nocardioides nitrophenolicus]|uniref:hypothetical protein n=1 Tax=Nocardioides nitrophenolicus TaxID=60489 RepID=UPI00195E937E|nr:hypothetical protein [Nocardioides nitrophenolicus]MBM7517843.1 hypothetical protein [Nocardioides nitrophenolicus]
MRWMGITGGLVLVAVLAAGCNDGEGAAASDATTPTTVATATDTAETDAETETDAAALPAFCDLVTADQLAAAVGAAVTTSTGPFDACEFDQEDPRALSGSLGATDVQAGGGYESYQSGTKGALDSPVRHDLDGIGDAAYLDIGTVAGGENLQVAGGVLVGQVVYTLNLAQGVGLSEDELVATGEKLLRLMVEAG